MKKTKSKLKNITQNFDLPDELLLDIPLINMTGDSKMLIENFKNIYHYSENTIKINTSCGFITISGKKLFLKELAKNKLSIRGKIKSFKVGD